MSATAKPNFKILTQYLTSGDLARLFARTPLTILNWRRGESLPYVVIPGEGRDSIRYDLAAVVRWAERNGKALQADVLKELKARPKKVDHHALAS